MTGSLTVAGDGITAIGDSSYGYKFFWRNDDGSFRNNTLEFDRSGDVYFPDNKVGIGTIAPSAKLDVVGDVEVSGSIKTGPATLQGHSVGFGLTAPRDAGDSLVDISPQPLDGAGGAFVGFFRYGNTAGPKRLSLNRGDGSATVDTQIGAGGSDTFFTGGRVGVGTTTPADTLHVSGGNLLLTPSAGTDARDLVFRDTGGTQLGRVFTPSDATPGLLFSTGDGEPVMKISQTGNVEVAGEVDSTTGGFRFPDGTLQTTAASGIGSGRPDPPCFDYDNRYVDCGNGTVTDTVTGLIWLQDANCLGGKETGSRRTSGPLP